MTNPNLARDYLARAQKRLKAITVLLEEQAFADVVHESQEVVELALKAALRSFGIAVPFSHDLSEALGVNASRLPLEAQRHVQRWSDVSRDVRKDRELAFYGSEDVTPSSFYTRSDAEKALAMARDVVSTVAPFVA